MGWLQAFRELIDDLHPLWVGLGWLLLAAAVGGTAFVLFLYNQTDPIIEREYSYIDRSFDVPTDMLSIREGGRQARIHGCYNGCHGRQSEGQMYLDDTLGIHIPAPNLTRIAREYSVEEFERAVRQGVGRNGRGFFFMPSPMYANLTDTQLGQILAFLRSLPQEPDRYVGRSFGLFYRWDLYKGRAHAITEEMKDVVYLPGVDAGSSHSRGRYLAMTACSQCHGLDLQGRDDWTLPPSLEVVQLYSLAQFRHLLKTGEPIGNRNARAMRIASQRRFINFTEQEIRDIYGYLMSDEFKEFVGGM